MGAPYLPPPVGLLGVTVDWSFQTPDATPVTAFDWGTLEIPNNSMVTIESWIHARYASGAHAGGIGNIATFVKDGAGVLTLVQTVTATHNKTTGAAFAAAISASGGAIRYQVTGIAATVVNWRGRIQAWVTAGL